MVGCRYTSLVKTKDAVGTRYCGVEVGDSETVGKYLQY